MTTRQIDQPEREEIEMYLTLDEEQLYSLIPPYMTEYDSILFSPTGQINAGKRAFQSFDQQLKETLCKEWKLCKKLDDPVYQDTVSLVVVIGDALSTAIVGIPPILIASILVKIGVRTFCACTKKKG